MRQVWRGAARGAAVLMLAGSLAGCGQRDNLPPVFGAVFGIDGAAVTPFTQGRIPEPAVAANSRLIGGAVANPGACIWQNPAGHRFRAPCPEGSDGLAPKS